MTKSTKSALYWDENKAVTRGRSTHLIQPTINAPEVSETEKTLNKILGMNKVEINKFLKRSSATMMELMIGAAVVKAAKDGDFTSLDKFKGSRK